MAEQRVRTNFKSDQKPRVSLKRLQAKVDKAESVAVRKRSEGRCEVWIASETVHMGDWIVGSEYHCGNRADHVHHMIGGRGQRGIGISALAEHKQHVCHSCHRDIGGDIGGKRLERIGGEIPRWTDRYKRVR